MVNATGAFLGFVGVIFEVVGGGGEGIRKYRNTIDPSKIDIYPGSYNGHLHNFVTPYSADVKQQAIDVVDRFQPLLQSEEVLRSWALYSLTHLKTNAHITGPEQPLQQALLKSDAAPYFVNLHDQDDLARLKIHKSNYSVILNEKKREKKAARGDTVEMELICGHCMEPE